MMDSKQFDQQILLICEEIEHSFKQAESKSEYDDQSPYFCRINLLKTKIATERRIIEEISRPCRFILDHFSLFLDKWDYTIGFKYGNMQAGRGLLSDIKVGEWGNVSLMIGNSEIAWRDADYQYLFYPDKVILRPQDISKTDIAFYFSYAFKYSNLLSEFQDVAQDPQTIYWHEELKIEN